MGLKFDSKAAIEDFIKILESELSIAFEAWKKEVESKVAHPYYKKNANVDYYIKKETNIIIGYLQSNKHVLADSYGTGSLMLDNNPGFQEYKNSEYWNPARKGKAIAGRPSGMYKDIFGNTHKTSGKFKGINIEGMKVNDSKNNTPYYITPTPPSKALQQAEQWLYKTYLPRAYKNTMQRMNFNKYLIEYNKK